MSEHMVCPWWIGFLLASPLRRWLQGDPGNLLAPYVRPGMLVLEPGPGMGFFTLEIARLVGAKGRVIAVDIQPKMLAALRRRANNAGFGERIGTRLAAPESLGVADLAGCVDFVLAFAMVHEMPSAARFFAETAAAAKNGATMLLAEPSGHVKEAAFEGELAEAAKAGFALVERISIRRSRAAMLRRS